MDTIGRTGIGERIAAAGGPGTYRKPDGALVHCYPLAAGAILVCETDERGDASDLPGPSLVKLSDDPAWLDEGAHRIALLAFD